MSSIANASIAAVRVFPTAAGAGQQIFRCRSDEDMVTVTAKFLVAILPPLDPDMKLAGRIVETIISETTLGERRPNTRSTYRAWKTAPPPPPKRPDLTYILRIPKL